ncbi:MAG: Omp28-related outer membrane protein [Bacteroidota bacterium]
MKKWILFIALAWSFAACDEIPPTINLTPPERKVLVEEFTGVLCVNCPEGAERLEALLEIHGENLIVVSIHSGFFAMPHQTSQFDFRTSEGEALDGLVGPVTFYPSASVNRKLFAGENSRIVNANSWAGYIQEELSRPSPIQMTINAEMDALTRTVSGDVELIYFEDLIDPTRLTIYLLETNITDSQIGEDGLETDYIHRHVLRKAITPFDGQVLTNTVVSDQIQRIPFSSSIDENWHLPNLSLVAFVSTSSPNFEVQQVEQVKLAN